MRCGCKRSSIIYSPTLQTYKSACQAHDISESCVRRYYTGHNLTSGACLIQTSNHAVNSLPLKMDYLPSAEMLRVETHI